MVSIDLVDLSKVVERARDVAEKTGVQLDTEIICAQYNSYRKHLSRDFRYEFLELQQSLDRMIQSGELDGRVSRVSGAIVKVEIF